MLAGVPAGLAFRHDLLRQAAYESLPVSARLALHRAAGEALRRTGAPVVRVAGQLAIGARPGDAAAAAAIGRAATELAPSSPNAAADLAVRALELAGDQDERRAELVRSAVYALGLAGRMTEAREVGERYLAGRRPPAAVEAELQLQLRQPWVIDRMEAYPGPLPGHLLADPAIDPVSGRHADRPSIRCPTILGGHGEEADRALAGAMRIVIEGGRAAEFAVVAQLRVLNSLIRGHLGEALARAEGALETARLSQRPAQPRAVRGDDRVGADRQRQDLGRAGGNAPCAGRGQCGRPGRPYFPLSTPACRDAAQPGTA